MWPGKANFLKSFLNWLDFLAIMPFFIMLLTDYILEQPAIDPTAELDPEAGGKGSFVALKVRDHITSSAINNNTRIHTQARG